MTNSDGVNCRLDLFYNKMIYDRGEEKATKQNTFIAMAMAAAKIIPTKK